MTRTRLQVALILALFCAAGNATAADDAAIAKALASDLRAEDASERDARSRPEVVLGLLDLQPGDSAVDIFGGGGYYADLMAAMVGPDGSVILHNNTPYSGFVEKQNKARYVDNGVPGVTLLKSEVDELQLGRDRFDAALMVMSYHDLHYTAPQRGWYDTDVPLFLAQVHTALKPGGRLVIVDHAAAKGSGKAAAQDIHRIEPDYVKQEIVAAGFRFVDSSDVLSNPEDEHTKMVFDKSIRGETDRFILSFEK
ncbi:MAG: methyltransferase domain-containing protein [Gammaproteobacteria bacterium]